MEYALIDLSSVVQYGLDVLLETATSKVARLRTSSQSENREMCRSSLSRNGNMFNQGEGYEARMLPEV